MKKEIGKILRYKMQLSFLVFWCLEVQIYELKIIYETKEKLSRLLKTNEK